MTQLAWIHGKGSAQLSGGVVRGELNGTYEYTLEPNEEKMVHEEPIVLQFLLGGFELEGSFAADNKHLFATTKVTGELAEFVKAMLKKEAEDGSMTDKLISKALGLFVSLGWVVIDMTTNPETDEEFFDTLHGPFLTHKRAIKFIENKVA